MNELVLVGVSHHRGGVEAIEAWQRAFPDAAALASIGLHHHVLLSTCNRWEVLLALPEGGVAADLERLLRPVEAPHAPYRLRGVEALAQFTRVASSLDSLNPGEDQIMRQVRDAVGQAEQQGRLGGLLSFACETALRIARRARRETTLAPTDTSLFNLARPHLEARLAPGAPVAVLGAGEMARSAVRLLLAGGWRPTVVARRPERAEALAEALGCGAMALADFLARPPRTEALVCATPAAGLVDAGLTSRLPALRLVVDLGLPRNLAPGAAPEGVEVVDIDRLRAAGETRRAALVDQLRRAEALVADGMAEAEQAWTLRQLGPAIARLHQRYRLTIGDLLPDEEAQRLAQRFAHLPVKGLRALALRHGSEAVATFLREAELA